MKAERNISDESENKLKKDWRVTDFKKVSQPFDLGEVEFSFGWVFHRGDPIPPTGQGR